MIKILIERHIASLHLDFEECPTALNLLLLNVVPFFWHFHKNIVDNSINNVLHALTLDESSEASFPEKEAVKAILNKNRFFSF